MAVGASRRVRQAKGTQARTARARIAPELVRARRSCLATDELTERMAAARTHWLLRRADAVAAPIAECVLHKTVLARVIGNDRHRPARFEPSAQRRECALQTGELIVDRDAERLKEPRK